VASLRIMKRFTKCCAPPRGRDEQCPASRRPGAGSEAPEATRRGRKKKAKETGEKSEAEARMKIV
jgi:hypothetical protein